jgi:transposase-like protein
MKQRAQGLQLEIVLIGLRGDRSVRDVFREHEIAETLYYSWRDKLSDERLEAVLQLNVIRRIRVS